MIACPFIVFFVIACSVLQLTASDSPFDIIKLNVSSFAIEHAEVMGILKFGLLSRDIKIEYDVYIMMCLRCDKNG